jgi:hypothetical protein
MKNGDENVKPSCGRTQAHFGKSFILVAIACVAILLLGSCAGLPKPESPDDTLLIIPVQFKVTAHNTHWPYSFGLGCEGIPDPILISPTSAGHVLITGLPAGTFTVKNFIVYPFGNFRGTHVQSQDISAMELSIQTVAHTVTIAGFVFQSTLGDVQGGAYSQDFHVQVLSDSEKEAILKELQGEANFSAWDNGF